MRAHPPSIMLQGTASDVGKSLLTAALCRIFTQDGLRVAPFKSQNMSLNSCVTPDGLEMGRAQALQAAACRRVPDVRMNPILLKPTSDTGSQVVLMGKPVGVMPVRAYWDFKPQAFAAACTAYDSLAADVDVMVLEGAGSPAEINLRAHDIVNMTMARHAQARVLLVGDIDRGGVFAALVGTLALLEPEDRDRVAGLVINKFRGDVSLLPPALEFVRERTGKAVLGVVPWVGGLNLPDEDSVSFKAAGVQGGQWSTFVDFAGCANQAPATQATATQAPAAQVPAEQAWLDIALIDLPRISNATDVDALGVEPDVRVRVVRHAADLGCPDVIILPGSKNTLADLEHLRHIGMADALLALIAPLGQERSAHLAHSTRGPQGPIGPIVIGICAGLQLLGRRVHDPHGLEQGGTAPGLGLLDLETTLAPAKTLRRVDGTFRAAQAFQTPAPTLALEGYEIHHGVTKAGPDALPCVWNADGQPLGWARSDGQVWGSYTHGLFDADSLRRHLLDRVRHRKGLSPRGTLTPYSLEPGLDRLAATVRASLDMDALYALIRR